MKKKLLNLLVIAGLTIAVTGCGNKTEAPAKQKSKGNCDVFECIQKLESDKSLEEMNDIIGFEGTLQSETDDYKVYNWSLTDDTSITSQFMLKSGNATITANYPSSMVPKKADFSKWDEIKTKLKNKETISYDEFVKLVGGVQGTMDKKTSSSITYVWNNSDGGFLSAYFDTKTGNCTMATGRF